MTINLMPRCFPLGNVVITRGASSGLSDADVFACLVRHMNGDWGDLGEFDWEQNDDALEHGFRLLSRYTADNGTKFYIITEHDRSVTTILLPEEY